MPDYPEASIKLFIEGPPTMTEQQESSEARRGFLEAILENPATLSNAEVGEFLLELERIKEGLN